MPKLENEKHERFCNEYIKDLHLQKAYLRAYPDSKPESAHSNASRLMGNDRISDRIAEFMKAAAQAWHLLTGHGVGH